MGVGYFWYLDSCTFKKQRARRGDYTFHCYSELCQFIYCLLTRSRKVSSLPEMNSWEDYMDSEKIASFPKTSDATFLCNFEFGEVLRQRNTSEVKDFRTRCRRFIDRLVDVILSKLLVSSDFLQGVYCFCPELLLGGDDRCVFTLFSRLMRVLEKSGVVSSAESRSAVEEFATFVVDIRARHLSSGQQSEDIADVISYLLADYGFLARKSLCHVFKLCCLMIRRPLPHYPQVDISLNGCDVPSSIVTSCIRGIQSYVSTSHYQQGSFFTKHTMECVRSAISGSQDFMVQADFDPWSRVCSDGHAVFMERFQNLFKDHLARRKEGAHDRLYRANRSKPARDSDTSCAVGSGGSPTSSVVSAPATSTSSSAVSFRQSKTRVHSSLASLLGRKKECKKSGTSCSKEKVTKRGQISQKSGGGSK